MSDTKHTLETKLKTDNFRIRFDDEEEEFVAECNQSADAYVLVHRYNTHPALLDALRSALGAMTAVTVKSRAEAEILQSACREVKEALATARA